MKFLHRLFLDTETKSRNPITNGHYLYAEDSSCLLVTYALNDGEVKVWEPHLGPMPNDLRVFLSDEHIEIVAWNAGFDRTQIVKWMKDDPRAGWHESLASPQRWFDAMTVSRMAGLPGSLDDACKVLGLSEQYSKKDGKALIKKFCVPGKFGEFASPLTAPQEWQRFVEYAKFDIVAMREVMRLIPNVMDDVSRAIYYYTELMNDRGIPIDREMAAKAVVQATDFKARFKREAAQQSGIEEFNVVSQKALLEFLRGYGIALDDARSATLEAFLGSAQAELLPFNVRQVLETRLKTNKASVTKYSAMLKRMNTDDRIRGVITMYGANRTGRDSSRGFQAQNLARAVLLGPNLTMDDACAIVKAGTAELFFDDPLQLLSDTVRGTIAAPRGKRLAIADLSNIEGRCCPWLAGEASKVQYFRDFDAGLIKYDNYVMAYAKSFNVKPENVDKAGRQVGKVQELASQFGGSVGAYITFATAFRLDIEKLGLGIAKNADQGLVTECRAMFDWAEEKKLTYGLERDVWAGFMAGVKAWRASHSQIEKSWGTAEEMFRAAIKNPGVWLPMARETQIINQGGWLFVKLPSGRMLVYPHAHEIKDNGRRKPTLAFHGVNPITKKWSVIYTTGPRLVENMTQAMACDCLFWHIPAAEQAGYEIVLRVHDELVALIDAREERLSGEALAGVIGRPHSWCWDLPMAAKGDTTMRYDK